jgi:CHASE3 domain sensor protein
MIQDVETRREIEKIKEKLSRIENIKQIIRKDTAEETLNQVVDVLNEITKSLKRK